MSSQDIIEYSRPAGVKGRRRAFSYSVVSLINYDNEVSIEAYSHEYLFVVVVVIIVVVI